MPRRITDFSDNQLWESLRKRYALAQLDFPEGLGMWRVLLLKERSSIGRKPLHQVSPKNLQILIDKCIRQYRKLKKKPIMGSMLHLI